MQATASEVRVCWKGVPPSGLRRGQGTTTRLVPQAFACLPGRARPGLAFSGVSSCRPTEGRWL